MSSARLRLAIVCTHPIQYYAPWFRELARLHTLELRVFYLWDFGSTQQHDHGFGIRLRWDIDLLDGYAHEFVANSADDPGTHHYRGIDNPELLGRLREFAPDAVLMFGYMFRSLLRLLLRAPWPLMLRGDSHDLAPRPGRWAWAKRVLQRLLFRRLAAALPVGAANTDYFRARGIPTERMYFAPHCVDNARFLAARAEARAEAAALRTGMGLSSGERLVLFAGKFESKKQPLALVEAFLELAPPRCRLLLVGDGALRPALEAHAARHPQRIALLPFQNQSRMPSIYAAADLYVLPSLGAGETWGLAVNEAMCMGTAVLVSTHVGCQQDLVFDGDTGFVCTAGDSLALQSALQRALADDEARAKVAERGFERVQRYDYAAATAGLLQALHAVVPQH